MKGGRAWSCQALLTRPGRPYPLGGVNEGWGLGGGGDGGEEKDEGWEGELCWFVK